MTTKTFSLLALCLLALALGGCNGAFVGNFFVLFVSVGIFLGSPAPSVRCHTYVSVDFPVGLDHTNFTLFGSEPAPLETSTGVGTVLEITAPESGTTVD